ncbi:hypothetical protein FE257_001948 [Aspergillus nanangensis]|uniref:Guanine nucleotide-exchange factor SEC12 n=1 Tax=Aspergillus nanangensis TaxID=2582783 RepID=A0AAD4CDH7_ASPNN|nr:hypothetical protein FE257_001948 [Aspergillus nanangensis]
MTAFFWWVVVVAKATAASALLNTSKRSEISEVVDIELSRDEDSVTSLATAHATDDSLVALAGINSSEAEQMRDNNQHLRSFKIDYPPRKPTNTTESADGDDSAQIESPTPALAEKPTPGKTTPLSRASLFRTKVVDRLGKPEAYQRTLRLSPWKGVDSPRVAAIATGSAPGEIVFFNAVTAPDASDVIGRLRLDSDEEVADVDITDLEDESKFQVAYTNGADVFTCQISSETKSNASPNVTRVYSIPFSEKGGRKTRPKFRALRFLSPTSLLLLQNTPDRTGCELVLLTLGDATSDRKSSSSATILRQKKMRSSIKIGLGLDVCNLGTNAENQQQTAIAVSGSDQSIEILTVDYSPSRGKGGYGKIQHYTHLRNVHPFSPTKICFSHYTPPAHPVTPETPPQYIKLASVSMGNTVVVHTFPLSPLPPPSRSPRYVMTSPSDVSVWASFSSAMAALFSIFAVCFLLQFFTEIGGVMPPRLGAAEWFPPNIRAAIVRPYVGLGMPPPRDVSASPSVDLSSPPVLSSGSSSPSQSLRDLLHARQTAPESESESITIVRCQPDSNEIIIEATGLESDHEHPHGGLHRWEALSDSDQLFWKRLLSDAGHWGVEDGEMILHGVRFGEVCSISQRI